MENTTAGAKPAAVPGRRKKWKRKILWTPVWLVTVWALFVAIENWRGARAWAACVKKFQAQGESLDPSTVTPPPAADDENFAAAPIFAPLFDYKRPKTSDGFYGEPVWKDPDAVDHLEKIGKISKREHWWPATPWGNRDSEAFQQFAELISSPTPDRILSALSIYDKDLNALRAVAGRPRSRFPIHYEECMGAQLPRSNHLDVLRSIGGIIQIRALAELARNEPAASGRDVLLGIRIADSTREEPLLISQMVRGALHHRMIGPIWQGIVTHRWKDEQLAGFENALKGVDLLSGVHDAIRGEWIYGLSAFDQMKQDRRKALMLGGLAPAGWFDWNKVYLSKYYQQLIDGISAPNHRLYPDKLKAADDLLGKDFRANPINPPKPFAAMACVESNLILRAGEAQIALDITRIAVAIERYRLQNATVPDNLKPLVPQFIASLPCDPLSGAPYEYRRESETDFALESTADFALDFTAPDRKIRIGWPHPDEYRWSLDAK